MIAWLVKLGPWIIGLVKNIRWLGPFLARVFERGRYGFYVLLWAMAWGGKSAMAVGAIVGFLGTMAAGLTVYGGALAYARNLIPSELKCTLDYLHFFSHLRNIVLAGMALISIRVGIIAYKFGSASYRNFVMGLLDKLKTAKG